jgi:hypothetical protein
MNRKTAAQCLPELGNLTRLDIYRLLVRTGLDGMNIGDIFANAPRGSRRYPVSASR